MLVKKSKININKGLKSKRWYTLRTPKGDVTYMWRGGEEVSDSTHEEEGSISVEEFINDVDEVPIIAIYLGFYYIHTEREKRKLKLQVNETLSSVRYFLWDLNMALIAPSPIPPQMVPSPYVKVLRSVDELSSYRKVILMDPNAEENLTKNDVMEADVFLFGGVVDKEVPREGITSYIPCTSNCVRRKVVLMGKRIGVPFIVHKLAYVVLRARYELNGNLDEAIIEVMSSKDKRWRIAKEMIWAYRSGEDPLERAIKVAKVLKASEKDLKSAIKMSGLRVRWEDVVGIQTSYSGKD